ncbi:MAG: hypothetical protein MK170_05335 [Candidatus Thalassarchaeum sp.]|jgi:hypothetical protein|nr:hypothetical protein [Candidatus Thalassarchaeum sp.]
MPVTQTLSLVEFLLGFAASYLLPRHLSNQIMMAFLVILGFLLIVLGPEPIVLGGFIGLGWILLNVAVDRVFPIE